MRSFGLILSMVTPAIIAAQTLTLRLQAPHSAVYSFALSSEMTQEMGGMGMMAFNTTMNSRLLLESAQAAPDTLTMTWRIEGTEFSLTSPSMGMDTSIELPPLAAQTTLLPTGTVVRRQWLDSSAFEKAVLGQELLAGLTQGTSYPWKIEFPAKPVTVGESWEITHIDTLERSGKGSSSTRIAKATYRLEALVDTLGARCARIRSTTRFEFSLQRQTDYGTITVQGTGTSQGVAYVEVKSGFLITRQEDTETQMEMAFSGQMDMVGTAQQSIQYRLVRLQ